MEANTVGNGGRKVNEEKESDEVLKQMIATHPLYELLIESHLECLKVGLSEIGDLDITNDAWKQLTNSKAPTSSLPSSSELDHFMEGYCMALRKLKEAIEEPLIETKTFINAMYIQLKDLSEATHQTDGAMGSKNVGDHEDSTSLNADTCLLPPSAKHN